MAETDFVTPLQRYVLQVQGYLALQASVACRAVTDRATNNLLRVHARRRQAWIRPRPWGLGRLRARRPREAGGHRSPNPNDTTHGSQTVSMATGWCGARYEQRFSVPRPRWRPTFGSGSSSPSSHEQAPLHLRPRRAPANRRIVHAPPVRRTRQGRRLYSWLCAARPLAPSSPPSRATSRSSASACVPLSWRRTRWRPFSATTRPRAVWQRCTARSPSGSTRTSSGAARQPRWPGSPCRAESRLPRLFEWAGSRVDEADTPTPPLRGPRPGLCSSAPGRTRRGRTQRATSRLCLYHHLS